MKHDLDKQYWLFDIDKYYPSGGLNDIEFTTDDPDKCVSYARKEAGEFHKIVIYDSDLRKVILDTDYYEYKKVSHEKT